MTEPSSGAPSRLPAEPAEPAALDPAIAPDEALESDLDEDGGGAEADADELELDEEDEAEQGPLESEGAEAAAVGAGTPPAGSSAVRRRAGQAPVAPRSATQSELAVRVTDNQSRIFVIATVVVFALILAFGVLGGNGGVLTPIPTVAPAASAAPSTSAAASASPS